MAIRKNASLRSVAQAAFHRANRAHAEWRKLCAYVERKSREGHVHHYERGALDKAWGHFHDLDEIATHLLRLTGLDDKAIDELKDGARIRKATEAA